jgi:dTDP-4-amino-4,6-dideoxygalactose transaminase
MGVLESGLVKCGHQWTTLLEQELRSRSKIDESREVVLTVSGTVALRLAALALARGHRSSRRRSTAVLPSFTFAATGEFLRQLDYDLVFCDVDTKTWTLDPQHLADILQARRVDLVVSVDALGHPADYPALTRLCGDAGVPLLADSAPALGAYTGGVPVGTQADAHAFSLSMAKVVSAAGAGGFAVLPAGSRDRLEQGANWIRSSLMTEPNAVVALDQLPYIDAMLARRAAVAAVYDDFAHTMPGVIPQFVRTGDRHSRVHWVMRCLPPYARDEIAERMHRLGIETKPYYAPPLHRLLGETSPVAPLPVTETLAREVLALPMSSEMSVGNAERVVTGLRDVLADLKRG